MKRNVIICTAWPYIHSMPHLGNFLQLISGGVLKRYYNHTGANVIHVSGSDTWGARMELQASKEGLTPKELVKRNHKRILKLIKDYNIDFTNYTWTQSKVHQQFVKEVYLKSYKNGYITTRVEKKPYCNVCNKFLADRFIEGTCPYCGYDKALGNQCDKCGRLLEPEELINPTCAQCGKNNIVFKETKHWYLMLNKLQEKIKKYADNHPEWNEITKEYTYRWLKKGLEPRPITRDIKWGIKAPFPDSEGKTIYVWMDAVLGYVSATKELGNYEKWWKKPAKQVYVLGKDNIPFHTIILPAILISTGEKYTLPTQMSSTYFLNWEGGLKFSKTRGIGLWADEALKIIPNEDVWRFYIMLNRPEKRDREFSWKELEKTINNTLVGNIGNLYNRCLTFIKKHFNGELPTSTIKLEVKKRIINAFNNSSKIFEEGGISEAVKEAIKLSSYGNEFFQSNEPWSNKKTSKKTIYNVYQILRALTIMLEPITPRTSAKAWKMMGLKSDVSKEKWAFKEVKKATINKIEILYKKVDMDELIKKDKRISYDEFSKIKLMTAKILSAEPVGNKLYKLRIKADKERIILGGLRKYYKAEELVGKTIIIVANLEPKKMAGEISDGMLLAAENEGKVVLLTTDKEIKPGSEIH